MLDLNPEDVGEWVVVYMSFDFTNQQYTVSVDGVDYSTMEFANEASGAVVSVDVRHVSGTTDIDYIRTEGLTGSDRDTRPEDQRLQDYANQALDACIYSQDRDRDEFNEHPAGELVYPAIQRYCDRLHEGEICDETDLLKTIHYNTDCYWEANNYCQVVLFPGTGGFSDGTQTTMKGGATLAGAVPCTTLLATGAGWTVIAEPSIFSLWSIIRRNMVVVLILVFVLVVALPLYARRKK